MTNINIRSLFPICASLADDDIIFMLPSYNEIGKGRLNICALSEDAMAELTKEEVLLLAIELKNIGELL